MVRTNLELFDATKFGVLFFQVAYDSKYFLIVDFVVILGRSILFREEGIGAYNALIIDLIQSSAYILFRSIDFQNRLSPIIEQNKNRSRSKHLFQSYEGSIYFVVLLKGSLFSYERYNRKNNLGEVLNKSLYSFYGLRSFLF